MLWVNQPPTLELRVDFHEAKRIGAEGERLVAAELERIAPQYGLTVLNDLLLKVGPMTAQLDHVLIDRFGVLIIESKVRRGATIKGSDVQKQWTACYPGSRNVTFQNPLVQNREHENAVRQALRQAGNALNPDFVKSAVVFAEADLSQLELDSLARSRVAGLDGVEGLIRARHDFAVNDGSLSGADVASLAGLFRGLDRSADEGVVEQHAAYRSKGSTSASRTQTRSTPPRRSGFADRLRRALGDLAWRLLILLLTGALLWWLFVGPGLSLLVRYALSGFTDSGGVAVTAVPKAAPMVEDAKTALQEIDPVKYAALADPDHPRVATVAQGTTFTWEYVQASGNAAQVKTISLTLDANGQVVGVSIE